MADAFYGRIPLNGLSHDEAVCLDAILSTGLVLKQPVSQKLRFQPCPLDSLHAIVSSQNWEAMSNPHCDQWDILQQWIADPSLPGHVMTGALAVPLTATQSMWWSLVLNWWIRAILLHTQPVIDSDWAWGSSSYRLGAWGSAKQMGIAHGFRKPCYGFLRGVCGAYQPAKNPTLRQADLLRLLSGHLPNRLNLAGKTPTWA